MHHEAFSHLFTDILAKDESLRHQLHMAWLNYKVKLTWRDLTCCTRVSHKWHREFPREWLAYSNTIVK